jgi:hypothetical protein
MTPSLVRAMSMSLAIAGWSAGPYWTPRWPMSSRSGGSGHSESISCEQVAVVSFGMVYGGIFSSQRGGGGPRARLHHRRDRAPGFESVIPLVPSMAAPHDRDDRGRPLLDAATTPHQIWRLQRGRSKLALG